MKKDSIFFDGVGYVNNRGISSKYWGVSVSSNGNWIVSFQNEDKSKTTSLHAPRNASWTLSELDAAKIAAHLYTKRSTAQLANTWIRSHCGRFVYQVGPDSNNISRSVRTTKAVATIELDGNIRPIQRRSAAQKSNPVVQEQSEQSSELKAEAFPLLVSALALVTLTEDQKKALIDIINLK